MFSVQIALQIVEMLCLHGLLQPLSTSQSEWYTWFRRAPILVNLGPEATDVLETLETWDIVNCREVGREFSLKLQLKAALRKCGYREQPVFQDPGEFCRQE